MSTSSSYAYNPRIDDIVTDALERCGIAQAEQSATQVQSAIFSLNMALVEFANNQLNLWTVDTGFLPLITGQNTYSLPQGTIDLLEVTLRTSQRPVNGTAASSAGGVAANAFDGDTGTACTQTAPDGNISYDWGASVTQNISMVGIRSNNANTYTLAFEASQDGVVWDSKLSVTATAYTLGEANYYTVPTQAAYRFYRVRETGGATLNVQEVYFNTQVSDYLLSRLSRSEYTSFAQKNTSGRPSSFYVNRLSNPTVTFWQTPTYEFPLIYYNRIRQVQDVTAANQNVDVPYRFLEALISSLAYRMAVKYAPDRFATLKQLADEAFLSAIKEDRERVTFRIYPDLIGY